LSPDVEAAGHLGHLLRRQLPRLAQGLVDRRDHHILQHLDVVRIDGLGINADADDLLVAVGDCAHHAAASAGLHGLAPQLLLDPGHLLLHLLHLFHHLGHVHHLGYPPFQRRSCSTCMILPPNKRNASRTAVLLSTSSAASAAVVRSLSVPVAAPAPAGSSVAFEPASTVVTWILRPTRRLRIFSTTLRLSSLCRLSR